MSKIVEGRVEKNIAQRYRTRKEYSGNIENFLVSVLSTEDEKESGGSRNPTKQAPVVRTTK